MGWKPSEMLDTAEHDPAARHGPRAHARHALAVILRVGALLLSSGAGTNDVEATMRSLADVAGLKGLQPLVLFGMVWVAWDPGSDEAPLTMIRVVLRRSTQYNRLADLESLVRRL